MNVVVIDGRLFGSLLPQGMQAGLPAARGSSRRAVCFRSPSARSDAWLAASMGRIGFSGLPDRAAVAGWSSVSRHLRTRSGRGVIVVAGIPGERAEALLHRGARRDRCELSLLDQLESDTTEMLLEIADAGRRGSGGRHLTSQNERIALARLAVIFSDHGRRDCSPALPSFAADVRRARCRHWCRSIPAAG